MIKTNTEINKKKGSIKQAKIWLFYKTALAWVLQKAEPGKDQDF